MLFDFAKQQEDTCEEGIDVFAPFFELSPSTYAFWIMLHGVPDKEMSGIRSLARHLGLTRNRTRHALRELHRFGYIRLGVDKKGDIEYRKMKMTQRAQIPRLSKFRTL